MLEKWCIVPSIDRNAKSRATIVITFCVDRLRHSILENWIEHLKRAERRSHLVIFVNEYAMGLIVVSNVQAHSAVAELLGCVNRLDPQTINQKSSHELCACIRFQPQIVLIINRIQSPDVCWLWSALVYYIEENWKLTCSAAIATATRRFCSVSHTSCTKELFILISFKLLRLVLLWLWQRLRLRLLMKTHLCSSSFAVNDLIN